MSKPDSKNQGVKPTVLVLAASRSGADDPVARLKKTSHKCLAPIDGVVMLERVVQALVDADRFGRIYISIENEALLRSVPALENWLDAGVITFTPSLGNLADSVLASIKAMETPYPLVITTGDNALHTPELLQDFADQFAECPADAVAGFTRAETVIEDYPEVGLAYHKLKDGGYSSCNLYAFHNENALRAVKIFESGGQFGKKQMRILKSFGVMPFILYKWRLATLDQLITRIARNLGISAQIIMLPYSYGPIDVDNVQFFEISERTLKARRENQH